MKGEDILHLQIGSWFTFTQKSLQISINPDLKHRLIYLSLLLSSMEVVKM